VHSEGPARTPNQGRGATSATDANQETCPTFLLWRRYRTSELSQRPFRPEGLAVQISNAALGFEPVLEIVPVPGASSQEQLVCEAGDIGIRDRGLANGSVTSRFKRTRSVGGFPGIRTSLLRSWWGHTSSISCGCRYSARAIVPDGVQRRNSDPTSTSMTRPQAAGSSPQKRVACAGVSVKPGISRNSARTRWTRASKFEWRFNLSGLMKPPKNLFVLKQDVGRSCRVKLLTNRGHRGRGVWISYDVFQMDVETEPRRLCHRVTGPQSALRHAVSR
jgi:hypothetical protein